MANAKRLMVVGVIIAGTQILLLKKKTPKNYTGPGRPKGMEGMLNGPGGVVLDNETAIQCLIRKVEAECGIKTVPLQWIPFHELQSVDGTRVLFAKIALTPQQLSKAISPTDEEVSLIEMQQLNKYNTVPNIQWLAWMAVDPLHSFSISEDASNDNMELTTEMSLMSTAYSEKGWTPAPQQPAKTVVQTVAGQQSGSAETQPESKADTGAGKNEPGGTSENSSNPTTEQTTEPVLDAKTEETQTASTSDTAAIQQASGGDPAKTTSTANQPKK